MNKYLIAFVPKLYLLQKIYLFLMIFVIFSLITPSVVASDRLEEVVVTAQKREQNLQDAPIAITAFDSTAIDNYGIKNISDIGAFAPNVLIANSPGGTAGATISVRGSVTINPAITWEPTVGIYLDNVFLGKNIGAIFDIAELDRVEILRGPQGSLYGKNTVGGAINLITRKPAEEAGGKARATMGNFGLVEGYINGNTGALGTIGAGFGELKANFSYLNSARNGFYKNKNIDPFNGWNPAVRPASSSEFENLDNEVMRADFLLDVTDNFNMRYVADFSDRTGNSSMGQLTDVNEIEFSWMPGGYILAQNLSAYEGELDVRPDEIGNDFTGDEESKTSGHALTLSLDAGDWGSLGEISMKSITAYRTLNYTDLIDVDGSTLDYYHSSRDIEYDQASQEFQILGKMESVEYVFGLYYFNEEADVLNPISFFNFSGTGEPTEANEYGLKNTSTAIFGQFDWHPSDSLSLTAGGRWTEEEKDSYIMHPNAAGIPGATIPLIEVDDKWNNVSLTFIAAWDLTDNMNFYGKIAEGWKSGGFNGEAATRQQFEAGYDAEEVFALELGIKSRLLDDRLQLNAAVFQNQVNDMQLSVFTGGSAAASIIDNAGESTVTGFELEATGQVGEALRLTLAYGYLHSKYDEYIDGGIDEKENRDFPFAPRHTVSIAGDYTIAGGDWGVIDIHVDWSYKDEHEPYTLPNQNTKTHIDSYAVLNARLILSEIKLGWNNTIELSAWAKNLTDAQYNVHGIPYGLWTVNYYGDPKTFGLDMVYEF
ncbi:MAG: TonB-dependent receptor [Gammaproteobacteria bacterium]|nr:TonB-dependent receptor [Gammaproteobacteria bacterium]